MWLPVHGACIASELLKKDRPKSLSHVLSHESMHCDKSVLGYSCLVLSGHHLSPVMGPDWSGPHQTDSNKTRPVQAPTGPGKQRTDKAQERRTRPYTKREERERNIERAGRDLGSRSELRGRTRHQVNIPEAYKGRGGRCSNCHILLHQSSQRT